MSTVTISSNGIVGHLHFFHFVFPEKCSTQSILIINQKKKKKMALCFMPGPNPPQGRRPISLILAFVCAAEAQEPANSSICTANIC